MFELLEGFVRRMLGAGRDEQNGVHADPHPPAQGKIAFPQRRERVTGKLDHRVFRGDAVVALPMHAWGSSWWHNDLRANCIRRLRRFKRGPPARRYVL